MDTLKKFFERDKFAEHVGIELVEAGKGYAKARLKIRQEHLNGVDIAHGGAIFTLADLAFAVAANSHGTVAVAVSVTISFLKAVTCGTVTAEAREVSLNPKLASYSVTVTDENGTVIALFQGMAYRKKEKLPLLQNDGEE